MTKAPEAKVEAVEAKVEAKAETKETKASTPESYELKASTGEVFDAESTKDFAAFAKQAGLSQESAQTALAAAEKVVAAHQSKAYASAVDRWAQEVRADKDIGGEKLTENLSMAEKAIAAFGTPGLQKLLKHPSEGGTGWGNHRDVIATFAAIGRRISADGFVAGKPAPVQRDPAKMLFDKSPNLT